MICRLCLENLKDNERALLLFEEENAFGETKFVKMIAKYLQLQLSEDDSISGKLCNKCVRHLEEFDNFAQLVEQKQSTLRNEFLEIKCEANWSESDDDVDDDDAYEDYADLETERKHMHRLMAHMQNQLDEREISLDKLPILPGKNNEKPLMSDAAVSSDDDLPLLELRKKRKRGTPRSCQQKTKTTAKSSKSTKTKLETLNLTATEESTEPAPGEATGKRINLSEITKKNEQLIASHMKLICELCSTICETFSKLKTHFNSEHHEKKAYVKCCNNTYDRPSRLVEHIKWHKDPDTYKCHICDKRLRGKSCLDVHIETKHNEPTEVRKSRDKCNDNSDSDLTCPKCPRKFRTQLFFKKHVEKHESGQEQKYDCNICGKCFINIHRLRRHIESIHEDLHPHVCDICGKKFKFKPSFERHLLEHQGIYDEPLQCQECGDWLKNEHTFRLHRFKHQKEEIACTYCGKICITRTALRGHISYMHKEKPLLQCKYCDKSFKEKKNYNEHVAVHTGALLYACQHCSKEFRSKANMYVHVKRYHVQEWLKAKLARSNDPNLKTTTTSGNKVI